MFMAEAKKRKPSRKTAKPAKGMISQGTRWVVYIVVAAVAVFMTLTMTRDGSAPLPKASKLDNLPTTPLREEFLKEGLLTFFAPNGERVTMIDIEIAEAADERNRGLMFREQMAENQGMLFIFPVEFMQSFWMKNTLLSLDMIFVNDNREIVTIQRNTTPLDEGSYKSSAPARYVVEVNAGFADRHGIREGYRINWLRTD